MGRGRGGRRAMMLTPPSDGDMVQFAPTPGEPRSSGPPPPRPQTLSDYDFEGSASFCSS